MTTGPTSADGYFDGHAPISVRSVPLPRIADLHTCFAAPGLITGGRVRGAHHLGWLNVDGWSALGLPGSPELSMNGAEARVLGEWSIRDRQDPHLVYVGLGTGTGVGSAGNWRSACPHRAGGGLLTIVRRRTRQTDRSQVGGGPQLLALRRRSPRKPPVPLAW